MSWQMRENKLRGVLGVEAAFNAYRKQHVVWVFPKIDKNRGTPKWKTLLKLMI